MNFACYVVLMMIISISCYAVYILISRINKLLSGDENGD